MKALSANPPSPKTASASALLYTGFAASGFGCALPGVLLPLLFSHWHWTDREGGFLFLLITAGSALGPLALRPDLRRTVGVGHALVAASLLVWAGNPALAYPAAVTLGLGLGLVMTGISLLGHQLAYPHPPHLAIPFAKDNPATPTPDSRGAALVRLNFIWALGASLCPTLVSHALRTRFLTRNLLHASLLHSSLLHARCSQANSLNGILLLSAAAFAALSVVSLLALPAGSLQNGSHRRLWSTANIPIALLLAAALSTGVEASGGAWLAAYAQRYRGGFAITFYAPTCFWAGLLTSRALSWLPGAHGGQQLGNRRTLRALLLTAALATASLLLPLGGAGLLLASFLLGFGLGPLYPELLARVLAHRQTSTVFVLAGLASALVPWATGLLSSATGSLRAGFLMPLAAALVLLFSGWKSTAKTDNETFPQP